MAIILDSHSLYALRPEPLSNVENISDPLMPWQDELRWIIVGASAAARNVFSLWFKNFTSISLSGPRIFWAFKYCQSYDLSWASFSKQTSNVKHKLRFRSESSVSFSTNQVEVRKIGVIGVLQFLKHFRLNASLPMSQMMSQSQSSLSQVDLIDNFALSVSDVCSHALMPRACSSVGRAPFKGPSLVHFSWLTEHAAA